MSKSPKSRYTTAQDFADDIRRFLENKPIQARRPGPTEYIVKWTRRHRAVVSSVILTIVLSLAVGFVLLARAYETEREQRTIAEQERAAARAHLMFARDVVDDMFINLATEWLAKETAVSSIQTRFLRRAQQFYQRIADESAEDTTQREAVAEAHAKIGEIHKYLNEHQPVAEALKKSIEVGERLRIDGSVNRDQFL